MIRILFGMLRILLAVAVVAATAFAAYWHFQYFKKEKAPFSKECGNKITIRKCEN